MRRMRAWIIVFLVSVLASQFSADARAAEFRVLIDKDGNPATGCTVTTASGSFAGVETVLITSINTAVSPPVVTGVSSQNCSSPPSTFDPPVAVDPGGWPLGLGVGVGGYDAIETYIPNAPAQGVWRLGFMYQDGAVGEDAVVATTDGTPILLAFNTSPIPTLTSAGVLLLSLVLAVLMYSRLRKTRAGKLFLLPLLAVLLVGQLWAAIVVVLDGQVGDWVDTAPLAQDAINDAPPGADMSAVFGKMVGGKVYFRADVKTAGIPTAAADSYSVLSGNTLAVGAAPNGLLANDTLGTPAATVASFGGGSLGGAVTTNAAGATVALGGGGSLNVNANGSLNFTPAAGFTGAFTFNYRMGNGVGTSDGLVSIAVNQAPAITSANTTTFTVGSAGSFGVTATGYPTPTVALSGCTLPTGVTFSGNTLAGTPASGTGGTYNCVFTAANGIGSNATQNFALKVNQNSAFTSANTLNLIGGQPTNLPFTIATSGTPAVNSITQGGTLPSGVSFSYTAGNSTAQLTGTPANGSGVGGPYTLNLTGSNGVPPNATQTLTINVADVNVAPSFAKGADVTVLEDAGAQTVNPWATAISKGGAWESAQSLNFQVTGNTNPSLFSVAPAVSPTGVLTFTSAPNANGSATLTLVLHDNGGTANGGVDTSPAQTFVISVTPVNDPPTFTLAGNQTVLENAAAQTVNSFVTAISPGPLDESAQTVTVSVSNNTNPGLFGAGPAIVGNTTLTYTPASNQCGSATITVRAQDNGGTANGGFDASTQTFTITVNCVNHAPSFTKGADQTVLEDAGPQTVAGWATAISPGPPNESGQIVSFLITGNTNPALFGAGPAVSSAGTLTYTTAPDANGTATITLVAKDNGGTANGGVDTSAAQTFVINATPVNDAPSFVVGPNQAVPYNAGPQTVNPWATAISPGPANESGQTVSFQIVSNSNGALFSAGPAVSPAGVLTYTVAGPGSATITLALQDNGGTANGGVDTSATQSFTVVAQQPPSITSANGASFSVGSAGSFTFTGVGFPTPINYSLSGCALPSGLGVSGVGNSVLSGTPASGTGGTYTCVLTASNGVAPDATQNPFTITVLEPPVVVNDSYPEAVIGNVPVDSALVSGGPFSVTANDTSSTPVTITAYDATSAHGGTVAMTTSGANIGQFTYNPPAGYEGADSFTYTLTNSGGSAVGTVTLNVAGMIWFIDNNAGSAGDGRLGSPFNTLAAFQAINNGTGNHPAANDSIFLYESATAYTGGVALLSGQKLVGQDATETLSAITGLTPAASSAALPVMNSVNGTTATLTSAGVAVALNTGNTIKGLTLGSAATALSGSSFGTLTVKDVVINNPAGAALSLNTGAFAGGAAFVSLTSVGGTNNVSLVSVTGSADLGSGALTNATGSAFSVSGGNGSVTYGGSIAETGTAPAVNVVNKTGGGVVLNGAISGSGGNRGVYLNNNTGASVAFGGLLSFSTGTSPAFTATGGGTVTATNTASTLAATTGTALNVANTMIGAAGLQFHSISASGGANGIVLDNTCGGNCTSAAIGGLHVDGDGVNAAVGGNASGGTLSNMAGADGATAGNAVYLNKTKDVVLRRMTINGSNQNFGIRGQEVEGFTLEYATVGGSNGTSTSGIGEGSIYFGNQLGTTGITGSATVTNCAISGGYARNFSLVNTSGTLNRLTITGTTFGQTLATSPESNLAVEARNGGTVANVTVTGSTFSGSAGDQANFTGQTGTTLDVVFQNNHLTDTHPGNNIGGGGTTIASQGVATFNASSNTQTGANGSGLTLFKATGGTSYRGTYASNTIGTAGTLGSGSATGNGIYHSYGGAGTIAVAMTGNGIHGYNGNGGIYADNNGGSYSVDFTITGNTTTTPDPVNSFSGLLVSAGAAGNIPDDSVQVCAGISGNDFSVGDPNDAADIFLDVSTGPSHMKLPGYAGSSLANVQTFVQGNNLNPGTTAVFANVDAPATAANFTGGSACALP